MLKWFRDCHTIEDVKKTYRKLCFKYHPDVYKGDNGETMQQINAEYEIAFERYKNKHATKAEQKGTAGSTEAQAQSTEVPEMFKKIINGLVGCDGVQIDVVGTWVWLTGNTYTHRDTIKKLGFKWANKKKAWYWHSPEEKPATRSRKSLDEIKEKYGCKTFTAVQYRIA